VTGPAPKASPVSTADDRTLPPRDRIIAAASDLFYRHGVRAVGVDTIIAAAGVAKASFYRHFPSKDELVAVWLRSPQPRWLDRVAAETERRATGRRAQLLVFFDVLLELTAEAGFAGCAYLNTAAELHESKGSIREVIEEYAAEVKDYLRDLAEAAGLVDAESLASELRLVVYGALIAVVAIGRDESVRGEVRRAAATLVEAALARAR
jgi:AcrR family transcriptional regulator